MLIIEFAYCFIHALQRKQNMTMNNAVVWLDHTKAQVIRFDADAFESEALETRSHHPHPHQNHADTHATDEDNTAFHADIASALKDTQQILVVGPAQEKTAFIKYLTAKVPAVVNQIKAVETVDHPSEGQLLTYARRHFTRTGGLK